MMRAPTYLTQLNPNDVLIGRGAPSNVNEGNRRFRDLVSSRKEDYIATGKRQVKNQIAREIVDTIVNTRRGRFVRKIESLVEADEMGVPKGVTAWAIIPLDAAIQKTKQALRDQDLEAAKQRCASSSTSAAAAAERWGPSSAEAAAGGSASSSPSLAGQQHPRMSQQCTPLLEGGAVLGDVRPDALQTLSQNPVDYLRALRDNDIKAGVADSTLSSDLVSPLRSLFERAVAQQQYDAAASAAAASRQEDLADIVRYAQQLPISSPLPATLRHTLKTMTSDAPAPTTLAPTLSLLSGASVPSSLLSSAATSILFPQAAPDSLAALLAGRTSSLAPRDASPTPTTAPLVGLGLSQALLEAEASESQRKILLDRLVAAAAAQQKLAAAPSTTATTLAPTSCDESAGEAALRIAAENARGLRPHASQQRYLRLSQSEVQLLEIVSGHGLPVWKSRAQDGALLDGFGPTWTWQRLADSLERYSLSSPTHGTSGLQNLLETSKQVVMLLESLRLFALSSGTPDSQQSTRNYQVWFEEELCRWASSLGVVGEHGRPVPFSSQVLLPESSSGGGGPEICHRYPAGLLDSTGCQLLFEQISCLTRLRSIAEKARPALSLAPKVAFAVAACDRAKTCWSRRPSWWVSEGEAVGDDLALLDMVLREGILVPNHSIQGDRGTARASLQRLGISKAAVQERVAQLMRHMHDYQVAEDRNEIFEERKVKFLELLGGQRREGLSLGANPLDSFGRRSAVYDPDFNAPNKRVRTSL